MTERYERTGEWRAPLRGEWFEKHPLGRPAQSLCGGSEFQSWILRRLDSPAAEPATARPGTEEAPEPDYRDGEQTANVVRVLEWGQRRELVTSHAAAAYTEAIRRVRAWEKAREFVNRGGRPDCGMRIENVVELLAILDAPSQP